MSQQVVTTSLAQPQKLTPNIDFPWRWIGILPFAVFALAFIFLPSLTLFLGAIVRIQVRLQRAALYVDTFNNPRLTLPQPGEEVTVKFAPEACLVLAGGK